MPKRSKSSKQWLQEHFSDPFVKKAQEQGYRGRAAFKLLEIQEKNQFIKPGMGVVDLGAAPGGWSQVAVKLLKGSGHVYALDILPIESIKGVTIITGDFTKEAVLGRLLEKLGDKKVDVVLSDMAPNISGIKTSDQARAMYLSELALELAKKKLKSKGSFLVKVFQGEGFDPFLKEMRTVFDSVKIRKPKASRGRSKEVYILGVKSA